MDDGLQRCLDEKNMLKASAKVQVQVLQKKIRELRNGPAPRAKASLRKPSAASIDRKEMRDYLARARPAHPQGLTQASLEALPNVMSYALSRNARKDVPNVIERIDAVISKANTTDKSALRWATIRILAAILRA